MYVKSKMLPDFTAPDDRKQTDQFLINRTGRNFFTNRSASSGPHHAVSKQGKPAEMTALRPLHKPAETTQKCKIPPSLSLNLNLKI